MSRPVPIHIKIADRMAAMIEKGSYGRTIQDRMENGQYLQRKTEDKGFYLRQEISIIDIHIYDGLRLSAVKILINIQQELQVNNPIWECKNSDKSETRLGLAQLKEKDIIEHLGNDIYIVNPEKIRRGKPLAVLAAIYSYSKKKWEKDRNWRLSSKDIKNLLAPEEHQIDSIIPTINITNYQSDTIEDIPTIVEEDEPIYNNDEPFIN